MSDELKELLYLSSYTPLDGYGCAPEPTIVSLEKLGVAVDAKAIWVDDRRGLSEYILDKLDADKKDKYQAALAFSTPAHYKYLEGVCKFRIGFGMHESTTTKVKHPSWARLINAHTDLFIVPSGFSKSVFTNDGVVVPVKVVPLGVEKKAVMRKPKPEDRPFTFFTYGSLNYRKSPDYVMDVFRAAFPRGDENVRLILKTSRGTFGLFNDFHIEDVRIRIINASWTRNRLNGFIEDEVDAGIWLCRGEGFNLPPLETMGAGVPVILAANTGNLEFSNPDYCYPVPTANWVPCPLGGDWATPDWSVAVEHMRYIYENQEEAAEKGLAAGKWVMENWTWDDCARKMKLAIEECL